MMRELFTKDLGWKVFSLVVASILYFTIRAVRQSGGETGRPLEVRAIHTFHDVPVLVVSTAADVRAFKVSPASVHVTLRSLPENLNELQLSDIRAAVDLTGIESAQNLKKRIHVSTPPGITLVKVEPPEVDVVIPPRPNP